MANIVFNRSRDDQVPLRDLPSKVLGWCEEAVQEADGFLKAQSGYEHIDETIKTINGEFRKASSKLSSTTDNEIGKIAGNLTAGLTDIKPFWEFKTHNKRFERSSAILGKLSLHWWLNRFIDLQFSACVQYAIACGTGWTNHVGYDSDIQDLGLLAEDPRDVRPIRPATLYSIQDSLGVVHVRERPIHYIESRWEEWKGLLKPDRDRNTAALNSSTRAGRLMEAINSGLGMSPFFLHSVGERPASELKAVPTKDLFTLYVKDDSRNTLNVPIVEGDPDANWSYIVPPGGLRYPRKRLIIFVKGINTPLYDGPSPFWHGLFPFNKLTLDPWPWTWLGKSPLWDILSMQDSLNKTYRIIDDHNARVAEPGLAADKTAVGDRNIDKMNTRLPGLKARLNMMMAGRPFEMLWEPPLDPSVANYIPLLIDRMENLSGVRDLTSLTKLGQIPSAETVEKIIENLTPVNRLRSRYLEAFMREFAMMAASNFCQFYTTPTRMQILGADGITFEDFDFDPGNLIPDFVHDEDFGLDGSVKPEAIQRGPRRTADRASYFLRYFTFHVAPGSLLAASEITRKMLYLQLARAGLIDHWTLLEVLGIPNVGNPPGGEITITDRLVAEKVMGLDMMISTTGRKASGQTMPKFVTKDQGMRSTISES